MTLKYNLLLSRVTYCIMIHRSLDLGQHVMLDLINVVTWFVMEYANYEDGEKL